MQPIRTTSESYRKISETPMADTMWGWTGWTSASFSALYFHDPYLGALQYTQLVPTDHQINVQSISHSTDF